MSDELPIPVIAWAGIGVLLVIAEIVKPIGYFASFALAAFIVASLAAKAIVGIISAILVFAIVGAMLAPACKHLMRRRIGIE